MPAAIDEIVKRKVIQQWFNGLPRDKIAAENNLGAGTVTSIISNYKVRLETLDFDSIRQLSIEIRKQGLNWSDLASHYRLYNYIKNSGAAEEKIESFIDMVHSTDISPEKVIELVNQFFNISKSESIPLDQVSRYINKKLEEKQKIDEEIKQADAALQNKNVTFEAISEHLKLKEELDRHGVSMQDIDKLLKLLSNAKRYAFDGKEIADKLYNMLELEWKEKELKNKCKKLSRRISKYIDVVPLTEDIAALAIGIDELLALKIGINQAARHYNLPPLAATLRLIDDIKIYIVK
jgi:protein tyrosine phosphatase